MPTTNDKEALTADKAALTAQGYKVDLWDALSLLELLPPMGGRGAYAKSYRHSLYELYADLRSRIPEGNDEGQRALEHMWKCELVGLCKSKVLYWVHQLSSPDLSFEEREEAQANIDFYSVSHDMFREEL